MTGVGEYSASRLRDYASAWRATGCGCGDCSQCAARDLTAKEADEIAECIDTLRREAFRLRAALAEIASLKLRDHCGPHAMALACVSEAQEAIGAQP